MEYPFLFIISILISNLITAYAFRFMVISVGIKPNIWNTFFTNFSGFKIFYKYIKQLLGSYGEKIFKKYLLYLILFLVGFLSLIIEVYFFVFRYLLTPF